jgi:GTPase SAR1 family protein
MATRKLQIIILGDGAVGKTSILKMYAENKYTPSHITTIGKLPALFRDLWVPPPTGTTEITHLSCSPFCLKSSFW